jgi:26S proteasome regulatory subunit N8
MSDKDRISATSSSSNENKDENMELDTVVAPVVNVIPPTIDCAIIHPLVLLSVVDHYTRVAKDTNKRVIGVLLGEENRKIQTRAQNTTKTLATKSSSSSSSKLDTTKPKDKSTTSTPITNTPSTPPTIQIDITNSYALPFEEDPSDKNALFLDKNYHEEMFAMFKKINANEKILGWYSTGTSLQATDLLIHEIFRQYCPQPVLVLIDVNSYVHPAATGSTAASIAAAQAKSELPTKAYISIENSPEEYSSSRRQFQFIPSQVGAFEAEEVGVEHLLRNIKDSNDSNLTDEIQTKLSALRGFKNRLIEISSYLDDVLSDKLPINQTIIANLQDMFNLTPNITSPAIVKAFAVQTNDELMVVYVSSLIRSIIALHDLINNKIAIRKWEKEKETTEEEKEADTIEKSTDETAVAQA